MLSPRAITFFGLTFAVAASGLFVVEGQSATEHNARSEHASRKDALSESIAEYRGKLREHPSSAELHYGLGLLLVKRKDTNQGKREFQEAVRLKPDYAEAHFELGVLLTQGGDTDGGGKELQYALRLKPDYAEAHYALGHVLALKGDPTGALTEFRQAVRIKPNYAEAHLLLGMTLQNAVANDVRSMRLDPSRDPRLDWAIAQDAKAAQLQPAWFLPHKWLALAWSLKGGVPESVIAEYRRALQLAPQDADLRLELDAVLSKQASLKQAIAQYRETLRLKPEDPNAEVHYQLASALEQSGDLNSAVDEYRLSDRADAHLRLASLLERRGKVGEAISEIREALTEGYAYTDADDALEAALYQRDFGWAEIPEEDIDDILRNAEQIAHSNPPDAEAHYNLGRALFQNSNKNTQEIDKAIAEFRKSLNLQSNSAPAHFALAWALQVEGNLQEAIAEYRIALNLKPDLAYAHIFLGLAIHTGHDVEGAIAEYQKAAELIPDNPQVHYDLGYSYFSKGDFRTAIAEYRKALQWRPMFADATLRLEQAIFQRDYGWALLDDPNAAITQYQERLRANPDDADAHFNLGRALRQRAGSSYSGTKGRHILGSAKELADIDASIHELNAALRLKPDFAEAHFCLGWAMDLKGDLNGAVAEYTTAIKLNLNRAYVHYRLGAVLDEQGDGDAAQKQFDQVLKIEPDFNPGGSIILKAKSKK